MRRSKKRKILVTILGSARVKAARKMLMKLTPDRNCSFLSLEKKFSLFLHLFAAAKLSISSLISLRFFLRGW